MSILAYDQELRAALSETPSFPNEEEAKAGVYESVVQLKEWQTYYLKFYQPDIPDFITTSPFVVDCYEKTLFEINFRNYVGLTRIESLRVQVNNRKISNSAFETMLDYITDKYENLIYSFSAPVGQHISKEISGKDIAYLEYLFLKKYLLNQNPNLEAISHLISFDPHRKFINQSENCFIQDCDTYSSSLVDSILSNPDNFIVLNQNHHLRSTSLATLLRDRKGANYYPTRAIKEKKYQTVDTNENRFVKYFLQELLHKLDGLSSSLVSSFEKSYLNPDIEEGLERLINGLSNFLSNPLWNEVGPLSFIPANSQVLQRRDGYRELFRLYSLLQLASVCDFISSDFNDLAEIKDVATVYEYWGFFQIKEILDNFGKPIKAERIVSRSQLDPKLIQGLLIKYDNDISLEFNRTYRGSSGITNLDTIISSDTGSSYSHNLRPDIVVSYGNKKLIFDTKHKGKTSGFYGEEDDGRIQSWKDDDIDKMHCYKDAINGVVGSFILYPGKNFIIFSCPNAKNSYEGVGAFPFLPDPPEGVNVDQLNNIKKIIESFIII